MIYVNARFLTQNITGVQRFAIELSKALLEIRQDIVFLVPDLTAVVDKSLLSQFNIKEVKGGSGHYWEQVTLSRYLKSIGLPLLVNLCNTAPIFYRNKISTIHDITFLRYPKSYSMKFRLFYRYLIPAIIKTSRKILTVSEFSKTDICQQYGLDIDNLNVIHNAVGSSFIPANRLNTKKKYALAVSSPNLHKNFPRMIRAFLKAETSIDLKIIGSLSNTFNDQEVLSSDSDRVEYLGRISDNELIELYQNADFFIFPSLYEGFGIPPLEAQACGCPVISSNAASLPEILDNSVLFFNPMDESSIKDAIDEIASNHDLKCNLIKKGYENVKKYSWQSSAAALNQVINSLTN